MGEVSEWVTVETQDGEGRIRADHGALHLDGLSWKYLTAGQWEAVKAAGDALLAGARGRKAAELAGVAEAAGLLEGFAWQVAGTFRHRSAAPPLDAMTDADWAHVARVVGELEAQGVSVTGPLRDLWDEAGKALSDG